MYFSPDCGLTAVSKVISRDRISYLRTYLNFVDVNSSPVDTSNFFWKIRAIFTIVGQGCLKIIRTTITILLTNKLKLFSRRYDIWQYVPNKSRPTVLKNFVIIIFRNLSGVSNFTLKT